VEKQTRLKTLIEERDDTIQDLRESILDLRDANKQQATEINNLKSTIVESTPITNIDFIDKTTCPRPLDLLVRAARMNAKPRRLVLHCAKEDFGTLMKLLKKIDLSAVEELSFYSLYNHTWGGGYGAAPRLLGDPNLYPRVQGTALLPQNQATYDLCVSDPINGLDSAPTIIGDLFDKSLSNITLKIDTSHHLGALATVRNIVHLTLLLNCRNPNPNSQGPDTHCKQFDLRTLHALQHLEFVGYNGQAPIDFIKSNSITKLELGRGNKGILIIDMDCPELRCIKGEAGYYGLGFGADEKAVMESGEEVKVSQGVWGRFSSTFYENIRKLTWNVHKDCVIKAEGGYTPYNIP
jgi:hypothetical protein